MRTVGEALRWIAELGEQIRLYDPAVSGGTGRDARALALALTPEELMQRALVAWQERPAPAWAPAGARELGRVIVRQIDGRISVRWHVIQLPGNAPRIVG